MSAKASTERQITGGDLRSRVRRITAGCVGLAAVASAALTINLAASADDNKASADTPAADDGSCPPRGGDSAEHRPGTGHDTAPTTGRTGCAGAGSDHRSSTLAVPQQAPAASNGRSHTQSGGS